jgi:hypothetical protein
MQASLHQILGHGMTSSKDQQQRRPMHNFGQASSVRGLAERDKASQSQRRNREEEQGHACMHVCGSPDAAVRRDRGAAEEAMK